MKSASYLAVLLSTIAVTRSSPVYDIPSDTRVWNILSLDGGGIRGLITATVVDYMEKEAYKIAKDPK